MTECHLETSVTDWVIEHPIVLGVFQELQIDYCCGGKSLDFACREQNLDPAAILSRLRRLLDEAAD